MCAEHSRTSSFALRPDEWASVAMAETDGQETAADGVLAPDTGDVRRQDEAARLEHALSELGAAAKKLVELQRGHEQMEHRLIEVERAATQRGEALAQLQEHLNAREAEIERLRAEISNSRQDPEQASEPAAGHLLFISQPAGYRIEERPGPPPAPGETLVLGSMHFVVTKLGTSPLPADRRLCSYVMPTSPPDA
jgi:hypothetical protein